MRSKVRCTNSTRKQAPPSPMCDQFISPVLYIYKTSIPAIHPLQACLGHVFVIFLVLKGVLKKSLDDASKLFHYLSIALCDAYNPFFNLVGWRSVCKYAIIIDCINLQINKIHKNTIFSEFFLKLFPLTDTCSNLNSQ